MLDEKQLEIVNSKEPRIIVEAGGGSGKTRCLIERIKKLINDGVEAQNIVAITFTNMAAEEMKERLADVKGIGDCFIGTIHSFANKIFKNSNEEYKLFNEDIQDQFMNVLITLHAKFTKLEDYFQYKEYLKKIDNGLMEECDIQNLMPRKSLYEIKVFLDEIEDKNYPQTMKTLCKKHNVITFDELLKKTTQYFKEINGKVEYLFVDEYQDIGPLEKDFFISLNADNYFYIGDEKQCQPAGTKITMADGTIKNIEDLKIGDEVLSYNLKEGHYLALTKKGKGKKISDISEHYENELIQIITQNGLKSFYTKNHKCFARIHYEGNENKSVVYIMQNKKGQYRVGSTKLFNFNDRNFGLRSRMNTEKAINGWILNVFDNAQDAWLAEQLCAYKFGIPQITWTYKNVKSNESDIDKLYYYLGDITENVKECLSLFGRDINYPIFTKNRNKHFSKIHITEVHACNLIPSVMDIVMPCKDEKGVYKNNYFQIEKVNCIKMNEPIKVYGLKVEDTETYVADGILTHNSIYAFKGGNVKYFLNLINSPKWKTYYLNNNYRCGQKIIDVANEVICQANDIINMRSVCKSGKQGEVIIDNKLKLPIYLRKIHHYKDWFFLVRTNKDLAKMEQILISENIPYVSFKKGEMSLDEMRKCMAEDKVKLLTIHTSKGLESPNVLMWGNFPIKERPYLRNNDELKVRYVGITRAIDRCIILN